MDDLSMKLLDLINEGYSLREMSLTLGLSDKQIYKLFLDLERLGMRFRRRYYSDGEIVYKVRRDLDGPPRKNKVNIITSPAENNFRAMVISDLHIGSGYECVDAWNKVYDYCVREGIHTIIIAGDFLDGITIGRGESKFITEPIKQMEYAIWKYPKVEGILNFALMGNHDVDLLTSYGFDFTNYLSEYRHDIVPIGFGSGVINVKNEKIFVTHPLGIGVNNNLELGSNYLLIKGHHHHTKSIIGNNGNCCLTVPSLSRIFLTDGDFLPGAIDLNIKFKDGYFEEIFYEHLLINERVNVVSETHFMVAQSKGRKGDEKIKYEEDRCKRRVLEKK